MADDDKTTNDNKVKDDNIITDYPLVLRCPKCGGHKFKIVVFHKYTDLSEAQPIYHTCINCYHSFVR
jgi:hypothetical protein